MLNHIMLSLETASRRSRYFYCTWQLCTYVCTDDAFLSYRIQCIVADSSIPLCCESHCTDLQLWANMAFLAPLVLGKAYGSQIASHCCPHIHA